MKRASILYLFCIILTMTAIFRLSAQDSKATAYTSDIISKPIEESVKRNSEKTFKDEKEEKKYWKKTFENINLAVRKSAHATLFFVLCLFAMLFFSSLGMDIGDVIMCALLLAFAYACSDELHQRFSSRDPRFGDVCIDLFGAWLSSLFFYISFKIHGNCKSLYHNKKTHRQ